MSDTCFAADPGRVADLAAALRAGQLTSVALVERCLARIDAVEPRVRAWRTVMVDAARAEAAARDAESAAGQWRGPLHGIPIGIKDIIDVAGETTLAGSRSRAGIAPAGADAEIVAQLRQAGAVILGKTHTTEFATFDPSPACNPHDIRHTPGGSSSGSGAAVAAGMVPLALGTQTVASVNRPAAYCGIGAFKPSTQSTPTSGIVPLAPMFDTVGFYGAGVADAVALWEALAPDFLGPPASPPAGPLDLVALEDPSLDACDPAIRGALAALLDRCAAAGHRLRRVAAPDPFERLFAVQVEAMRFEAARLHGALRTAAPGLVGPKFTEILELGSAIEPATYLAHRRALAEARARLWAAVGDADAVLFPATPAPAPEGLGWTGDPRYISPLTAHGGPIVTQPLGRHPGGLPIAALVCGRPGSDRQLARIAVALSALAG